MKKILVPTDFSQPAHNAARYAINLAKGIKANVELCHAMFVPAESPFAAQSPWPVEDYSSIKKQSTQELKFLANKLAAEEQLAETEEISSTKIEYTAEAGSVAEIVSNLVDQKDVDLVVMGLTGKSQFMRQILGSNSLGVLNMATFPVLLVPDHASFKPIKKIAFATDLSAGDIDVIHCLSGLARHLSADILITHVSREKLNQPDHQKKIDIFISDVICKVNYNKIYYRHISEGNVDSGLSWLIANSGIDILVMVHRQRSFFSGLFKSSHTKRLAKHIQIPLFVFPENVQSVCFF